MARYSKQREVIENILHSTTAHPSAAEVYAKAKEVIPNISLGTV
ncbi:MAG: transcriptional repressor, partial [Clostridia bacterium]|nr:transcriptional repressor [Clostridia bacterium]